ncbi:MAG TPA: hypothetical protein VFN44_02930 [Solirubrobacteraceae bacterium]|nr:hypothetical protein [Solirubrobacteraceae bacterium]
MSDSERSSEPPRHAHRVLVPILLLLASLALFTGAFAVWVNRQALNTENWKTTSSELLADEQVQAALAPYLVDQLFTNVDVTGAIQQRLPSDLQVLAGPATAGLRQLADRAAPKVLAEPRVQDAWVTANAAAHEQLLKIINGGGPIVSTAGGVVTLDLNALVKRLAAELGVSSQVAAAQAKLQGTVGEQAKAQLQQRLDLTVPSTSGKLEIMRSDELKTAQDVAGAVKSLAIVLPALAIALFALAIWLARDRRRQALRSAGWCFVVVGALLLLIRRIGGNEIVDSLVKVPSNEAAVHQAWMIATSLLFAIAVALVVYGLVFALAAWLGGPTRPARFLRKLAAPELRESPAVAYAVAGGLLLALVLWGPTPAFRQPAWILLFAALLALGVAALRRQTAAEFPGVQRGDAVRELRERRKAARERKPAIGAGAAASGAAPPPSQAIADLERLVVLHDSGQLSDTEFATAKTQVMNGS